MEAMVLIARSAPPDGDGSKFGRKKVGRLMRRMSIQALCREPKTSRRNPGHWIYP